MLSLQSATAVSPEQPEFVVLREIGASRTPLGCWRIRAALDAAGIATSEATAGRILRQLDVAGLTALAGTRGRILTDSGRAHLRSLEQARQRDANQLALSRAVRVERVEDILDILRARRAVEAETAGLAALHATPAEVGEMERLARALRAGESSADIHRLVAQASRSRVLLALVNVLLQDQSLHEMQMRITHRAGGLGPAGHLEFVLAIGKRQPKRAAAAMRAHLDRLFEVVEGFSLGVTPSESDGCGLPRHDFDETLTALPSVGRRD